MSPWQSAAPTTGAPRTAASPTIGAANHSTANSVATGNIQYVQATLSESRAKSVKFSFPPDKLKLSITAKTKSKPGAAKDEAGTGAPNTTTYVRTGDDIVAWGELSLTVDPIYLVGTGAEVNTALNLVLGWADAFRTDTNSRGLTLLKFQLGSGSGMFDDYQAALKAVTANIERYDQAGLPVRVSFGLTMLLAREPKKGTNPSSRGESGSSVHRIVDGDSICGVAETTYGHPRYWREVAEANDIDDPLRPRAGQQLYLPPPTRILGVPR